MLRQQKNKNKIFVSHKKIRCGNKKHYVTYKRETYVD